MESLLWQRLGELADAAPACSDLRHHKLQLIAASRRRSNGDLVPAPLVQDERLAAIVALAVPTVLRRLRAACDGRVVLMKGAEAAARWPHPRLRRFQDIDLLVENPDATQAALLQAGFVELDDPDLYDHLHHFCPIGLPDFPLSVEVHRQPHWCAGLPPATAEIVAAAQPCVLGIDGISAPRPDHHAVLLAVHAWAHGPLDRIGPLADVAFMLDACTREAAARVARAWGVSHIWRATTRAIDELLTREPAARIPVWKRHIPRARERTVFEAHVTRIVGPVTAVSAPRAPAALIEALSYAARPRPGETWTAKLRRSMEALRHATWSRSRHESALAAAMRDRR